MAAPMTKLNPAQNFRVFGYIPLYNDVAAKSLMAWIDPTNANTFPEKNKTKR